MLDVVGVDEHAVEVIKDFIQDYQKEMRDITGGQNIVYDGWQLIVGMIWGVGMYELKIVPYVFLFYDHIASYPIFTLWWLSKALHL